MHGYCLERYTRCALCCTGSNGTIRQFPKLLRTVLFNILHSNPSIYNTAQDNFILFPMPPTLRTTLLSCFSFGNIARYNFIMFQSICNIVRDNVACLQYPEHCAQHFYHVHGICNIAHNNFTMFLVFKTLRTTTSLFF